MALSSEAIVSLIALFVAIATFVAEIVRILRSRSRSISSCEQSSHGKLVF